MPTIHRSAFAAACLIFLVWSSPARAQSVDLTIHVTGSGTVGVIPGGNLCSTTTATTCTYPVASGSAVRLTANTPAGTSPGPGLFSGGTGSAAACGASTCSFTITAASEVTVTFSSSNGPTALLTTVLEGDGTGEIGADNSRCQNFDPLQFNACTGTRYLVGSVVTMRGTGAAGSRFSGFTANTGSATCSGTGQCSFTINTDSTVTGAFHALTSIAVSPATATKPVDRDQAFVAMGTYSNSVTEQIAFGGMGTWTTKGSMTSARYSLGAVAAAGRIYAVGGIVSGSPAASVETYDPGANSWSAVASMAAPRAAHATVTAGDLVYAIGGHTSGSVRVATAERYDPVANTWTAIAPMSEARDFLAAGVIDGIVYAAGGETAGGVVATLEAYDPATNTWTTKAPMPTARRFLAVGVVNGTLYAVGGSDGTNNLATVEAYDPATNTWSTKASMSSPAALLAVASAEAVLYAVGGQHGSVLSTATQYDAVRNTWGFKFGMPTSRNELAAVMLNGVVYAIGGKNSGGFAQNKVEAFTDHLRWSSSAPSIASVNQQGTALALSAGSAGIVASVGSLTCASAGGTCGQLDAIACTYALSPASASISAAASSGSVTVTTPSVCEWSVLSDVTWLTITGSTSGTGTASVGYAAAANTFSSARAGALTIGGQTFTVTQAAAPTMSIDRSSLTFAATSTGAAFTEQTQGQIVRLTQSAAGAVTWTAAPSQPWITVSPASGSGSAALTIGVAFHPSLPTSGGVSGLVSFAFTGATNSSTVLSVSLNILPTGASGLPAGAFETPADNITGVSGSIAVTGWALDDVEVTRVRILRDPTAGEGPSLIFIGNATFVDGARPDVAATFPNTPRNTRAGWGYLLLTNFLPNQGNGTFTLHAYADDADGHSTLLGSKTIACDNANGTKPFGAIDTPGQGDTVSGTVNNFGWVLARGTRRADPPSGGTVVVVVDGVVVGSPSGWAARSDLQALFPAAEYSGVDSALAVFGLNTAALTNGVHTIAWVVTDNLGAADGVGSRYFTVSNGAGLTETGLGLSAGADAPSTSAEAGAGGSGLGGSSVQVSGEMESSDIPGNHDGRTIVGRRGFDLTVPFHPLRVEDGRYTIDGEELDRFEVRFPAAVVSGFSRTSSVVSGFSRTSSVVSGFSRTPSLTSLPIGSHLDRESGVFTWQPGVAFLGTYDLVFDLSTPEGVVRQEVRIVLHPKASGRVGPQVAIDTPSPSPVASGFSRTQPILLAGWAIDLDSDLGTGVDTVHVWAYPAGGGDPTFAGAASYGGERPDVAAIHGERFARSGYGIRVHGLAPGTYDLAVFAWSTVQNRFVPAKVVRVTIQ